MTVQRSRAGTAGGIDWSELRARLERVAQQLEQPAVDDATRVQTLRARARAAARPPAPVGAGRHLRVVEFVMAGERYALEAQQVREVLALSELTPLPGAPSFVAGLVNARGQVLAVVDLKAFFELPSRGLPELDRIIVIGSRPFEFGLLVDAVSGVGEVPVDALQPALPTMTGVREDYLRGLTADRLAVLDVDRILRDARIVVRAGA